MANQALNPRNIQAMIEALSAFHHDIMRSVADLESAGRDCADNLEDDPAGMKANASLSQKTMRISEHAAETSRIISLLQEELEDITQRSRMADDF